jgi:hypothetical protein
VGDYISTALPYKMRWLVNERAWPTDVALLLKLIPKSGKLLSYFTFCAIVNKSQYSMAVNWPVSWIEGTHAAFPRGPLFSSDGAV